jgi:hypothetical protein
VLIYNAVGYGFTVLKRYSVFILHVDVGKLILCNNFNK